MKLANVDSRAVLLTADDTGLDIARASDGKFGPDVASVYEHWDGFRAWADQAPTGPETSFTRSRLGSPSPAHRRDAADVRRRPGRRLPEGGLTWHCTD